MQETAFMLIDLSRTWQISLGHMMLFHSSLLSLLQELRLLAWPAEPRIRKIRSGFSENWICVRICFSLPELSLTCSRGCFPTRFSKRNAFMYHKSENVGSVAPHLAGFPYSTLHIEGNTLASPQLFSCRT